MPSGEGGVIVTGEFVLPMRIEIISLYYAEYHINMSIYIPPEQTETMGEYESRIWDLLPSWAKVR